MAAHDPSIQVLPEAMRHRITLARTPIEAARGARALVIATEWPDYRMESVDAIVRAMESPLVLDANRFLASTLGSDSRIRYATVGKTV